jgi:hypothetical protein
MAGVRGEFLVSFVAEDRDWQEVPCLGKRDAWVFVAAGGEGRGGRRGDVGGRRAAESDSDDGGGVCDSVSTPAGGAWPPRKPFKGPPVSYNIISDPAQPSQTAQEASKLAHHPLQTIGPSPIFNLPVPPEILNPLHSNPPITRGFRTPRAAGERSEVGTTRG